MTKIINSLCFFAFFAVSALANDLTLIDGTVYKNFVVTKQEPDGVKITHDAGIAKVLFEKMVESDRSKFIYDAAKAAEHTKQQSASQQALLQSELEKLQQEAQKTQPNVQPGKPLTAGEPNRKDLLIQLALIKKEISLCKKEIQKQKDKMHTASLNDRTSNGPAKIADLQKKLDDMELEKIVAETNISALPAEKTNKPTLPKATAKIEPEAAEAK